MSEKERGMSDVRERLVALLFRQGVAWRQGVADAILAEFDVTPRGEVQP